MSNSETSKTGKCQVCHLECKLSCGYCKDAWYCCRNHQAKDWKIHKQFCLTKAERKEIIKTAKVGCEALKAFTFNEDLARVKLQRGFVNDHPWPEEEQIRRFLLSPTLTGTKFFKEGYAKKTQAPGVYCHSLAERVYQAIGWESYEQQIQEWRSIGHLLHKRGGTELMECHYYLIWEALHSTEIWSEEEKDAREGMCAFFELVSAWWNEIGGFQSKQLDLY